MTLVDKKKKMSRSFKSHIKLEVSIRHPGGGYVYIWGSGCGAGGRGSPGCQDTQMGVVLKGMRPSEILLCKYSLRTEPWGLVNFGVVGR